MATAAQSSALKDIGRFVPVKDIIAGGLARAASQSTIHPLDTVKVRMQATLKGVAGAAAPTPPSVGAPRSRPTPPAPPKTPNRSPTPANRTRI